MSYRVQVDDGNAEGRHRVERLAALVSELEAVDDPTLRSRVAEVLRAVLELHGVALARLLDLVGGDGERGQALLTVVADDPDISPVLLLHGLHPIDVRTRVQRALDGVRPYMHSHGGDVELVDVAADVVRLRLRGSCHGCPSSLATMRLAVERAIFEVAPEVERIEVEGLAEETPPPGLGEALHPLPLVLSGATGDGGAGMGGAARGTDGAAGPSLRSRAPAPPGVAWSGAGIEAADGATTEAVGEEPVPTAGRPSPSVADWRAPTHQPSWVRVDSLASLGEAEVRTVTVDGTRLIACRWDGTLYAYRSRCPGCGGEVGSRRVEGGQLGCSRCGARFEVRGAGRSDRGGHLEPVPLLDDGTAIRVALPVGR